MMDNSELTNVTAEDSGVNIELQPSAAEDETGKDTEEPGGPNPDAEKEEIQTFFSVMDQRYGYSG